MGYDGLVRLPGIHWLGHLALLRCLCPTPQILVTHLGGTDLGLLKGKYLIIQDKDDVLVIMIVVIMVWQE